MTNAFERHGIHYLSPSKLNQWISQPALCLLNISGIRDEIASPAAWRGQGADRAAAKAAFDPSIPDEDLVTLAENIFSDKQSQSIDEIPEDKIDKERKALADYVHQAAKFYRDLGETPEGDQGKVTTMLEDIPVPFLGYYDLLYADKVRDTKTVGRMVSSLTQAASRQASLYAHATKREPWIDYVGRKEVRAYRVERVDYWTHQLVLAAKSLERVLSHSDDILECCQLVYPDLDHWMWGDTTRSAAADIWNMENR